MRQRNVFRKTKLLDTVFWIKSLAVPKIVMTYETFRALVHEKTRSEDHGLSSEVDRWVPLLSHVHSSVFHRVVTSLSFQLYHLPTHVIGGHLSYPMERAKVVFKTIRDFIREKATNMLSVYMMVHYTGNRYNIVRQTCVPAFDSATSKKTPSPKIDKSLQTG